VKNVWFGFAKAATSPITDQQADLHTDDVPQYSYDPKAAEALLDEAGFKRGSDGQRLRLTIDYSPSGDMYRQTAEYVKQALARIGIAATIRNQDNPTFLRRIWGRYDFDSTSTHRQTSPIPSSDPTLLLEQGHPAKRPGARLRLRRPRWTAFWRRPRSRTILRSGTSFTSDAEIGDDRSAELCFVYSRWMTIHDKRVKNLNTTGPVRMRISPSSIWRSRAMGRRQPQHRCRGAVDSSAISRADCCRPEAPSSPSSYSASCSCTWRRRSVDVLAGNSVLRAPNTWLSSGANTGSTGPRDPTAGLYRNVARSTSATRSATTRRSSI
jgi:hypothetical protein